MAKSLGVGGFAGGERAGALGLACFDGGACWKGCGRGDDQERGCRSRPSWRRRWCWPGEDKDTGCGERGAGDRDKTLSRPCLVSKRKNFVFRARTTSLRSVVLSRLGLGKLAGPVWPASASAVPVALEGAVGPEAAGGCARHQAGGSALRFPRTGHPCGMQPTAAGGELCRVYSA